MYGHIQDVYLAVFDHLSLLLMSYNLRFVAFPDLLTMLPRFQISPNADIVTV